MRVSLAGEINKSFASSGGCLLLEGKESFMHLRERYSSHLASRDFLIASRDAYSPVESDSISHYGRTSNNREGGRIFYRAI